MEQKLNCLRCGTPMRFVSTEKIQLGHTSLLLGTLPNLAAGSMKVTIYCCPECGRLEFYRGDLDEAAEEKLPQRTCPNCGKPHDFDAPRCPYCRHSYYRED